MVRGLLIAEAFLVAKHRLQARVGSVVVAHGLSCSTACGIFLDQRSNPCPLPWQVDPYPLCHQEVQEKIKSEYHLKELEAK